MMLTTETERTNPYIVGRPIYEPELFFGRQKLFKVIEDNLKQNVQVILLHGQRRIGKSSVLMQIPNFVGLDEFVFIYFDLHDKTRLPLDKVLQNLAATIADKLNIPKSETFAANYSHIFLNEFLPQVINILAEKNKKMVWLLDEFDVLNAQVSDSPVDSFFPYLQTLISQYKNLFIIPVVGRKIEDLNNLKSLFRQAPNQEIDLLKKSEVKELVTKPVEEYLKYNSEAIEAILELTSGHPYFTQVICHALFSQAEAEDKLEINRDDVNNIIGDALEIAEGGLTWFRDGLPIPERVVFSAVAQAEKMADQGIKSVMEEPLKLLRDYGVKLTEDLNKAPENLVKWGFLERLENAQFCYKIKVKIVRYWLVKRYPLRQAIWDLEKDDLDACKLFELTEKIAQDRNLPISSLYEQILELNPNHFEALFKLAEDYVNTKQFKKALEKYKRASQIDPNRANDEYNLLVKLKPRIWWSNNFWKVALGLIGIATVIAIVATVAFISSLQDTKENLNKENTRLLDKNKQLRANFANTNATIKDKKSHTIYRKDDINFIKIGTVKSVDRFLVIDYWWDGKKQSWYNIYVPKLKVQGWIRNGSHIVIDTVNYIISPTATTKQLNDSPSSNSTVIVESVDIGDRVIIVGSSNDQKGNKWYKVYHLKSDKTGWIPAQSLAPD